MRSSAVGKRTSRARRREAEVLNVSPHGIWLDVRGQEYLLGYSGYPWFRDARIAEIFNVELLHGMHLRWPDLDVDIHLDSLRTPERFPLVSRDGRSRLRRASRR